MMSVALALFLAAQYGSAEFKTADRTDIPAAYQGTWALSPAACNEDGEAVVAIGPRSIDFYEKHGFLDLAQLDYGQDPPAFYGNFRWAELLHFSEGVARLQLVAGRLHITQAADPDARMNPSAWVKCAEKP